MSAHRGGQSPVSDLVVTGERPFRFLRNRLLPDGGTFDRRSGSAAGYTPLPPQEPLFHTPAPIRGTNKFIFIKADRHDVNSSVIVVGGLKIRARGRMIAIHDDFGLD